MTIFDWSTFDRVGHLNFSDSCDPYDEPNCLPPSYINSFQAEEDASMMNNGVVASHMIGLAGAIGVTWVFITMYLSDPV